MDAEGGTALMGVAFKGDLEVARYLAGERGAAVDAVDAEGGTALMGSVVCINEGGVRKRGRRE